MNLLSRLLRDAGPRPVDVDPGQAAELVGQVRLIDVRESRELHSELGHLPGIEHVPLAAVGAASRRWDPAEPVMVICRSGNRSSRAARYLVAQGFETVYDLAGGMLAWSAAGLPTCQRPALGRSGA